MVPPIFLGKVIPNPSQKGSSYLLLIEFQTSSNTLKGPANCLRNSSLLISETDEHWVLCASETHAELGWKHQKADSGALARGHPGGRWTTKSLPKDYENKKILGKISYRRSRNKVNTEQSQIPIMSLCKGTDTQEWHRWVWLGNGTTSTFIPGLDPCHLGAPNSPGSDHSGVGQNGVLKTYIT